MPRVKNLDTTTETPLPQLREAVANLKPGQKISFNNTKDELLKIRENITKNRHEIFGADSHLEYIEAILLAEAQGQLEFRK